jgi:histidine ammonia-lyase
MGANAATKCKRVIDNVEKVLAIELLTAIQALEFRRPLKTSPELEDIVSAFRKEVSFNDADRIMHDDIIKAVDFLKRDFTQSR